MGSSAGACRSNGVGKSMARPREFDVETALRAAGERFWASGYQATSIQDIATATGVKPGSLYKAFGDKRSLFLRCVDQYMESRSYKELFITVFDQPLPDCLEALFEAMIEASGADDQRPDENGRLGGCLVTNTAFELAGSDPELATTLKGRLGEMKTLVQFRLVWAQEAGELEPGRDLMALTAYLMTIAQGLLVSARLGEDKAAMRLAAREALKSLER